VAAAVAIKSFIVMGVFEEGGVIITDY